jgi:hypothetical protein
MDFTFSTQLHYLIHFVEGEYVAHCLDMDLVGTGRSTQLAIESLNMAVRAHVLFAIRSNILNVNAFCKTAPERYWAMFNDAKMRSGVKTCTLEISPEISPVLVKKCHFTYYLAVAA